MATTAETNDAFSWLDQLGSTVVGTIGGAVDAVKGTFVEDLVKTKVSTEPEKTTDQTAAKPDATLSGNGSGIVAYAKANPLVIVGGAGLLLLAIVALKK
jgi:hypothetical protein